MSSLEKALEKKEQILEMKKQKKTVEEMACELGITKSLMHKWIYILGIGRPKKPNAPKVKKIGRPTNSMSKSEARQLIKDYKQARGVKNLALQKNMTIPTMSRRLQQAFDICGMKKEDIKNW